MEFENIQKIGNVFLKEIKHIQADRPVYSDGPMEQELHRRFAADPDYGCLKDGEDYSSWAYEYHLTPIRHNLFKWYSFNPEGVGLEIGAGCGALTGLLCQKLRKVVALEYSYQRGLVTAQRHSRCSNLEVIIGGLQDYEEEGVYDYITVIGVMEYAPTFYGGLDPFASFLGKVKKLLKPDGELFLAIENKLGLKYVTGAPEDHTSRVFDSIYNYPYPAKVRTFSKRELGQLLQKSGFIQSEWYYPIPDYKLPQVVLGDGQEPNETDSLWNYLPAKTGGIKRKEVISERRFGKTLLQAGLYSEFANSFLVITRTREKELQNRCLRFQGSQTKRKSRYKVNITIQEAGDIKSVIKSADTPDAVPFIQEISKKEQLACAYFGKEAEAVVGKIEKNRLCYPFIDSPSLENLIAASMKDERGDLGLGYLKEYNDFLNRLPAEVIIPEQFIKAFDIKCGRIVRPVKCLSTGILDCIPANIKVSHDKWKIIDNEWIYEYPIPLDYVFFRGILTLMVNLQAVIQVHTSRKNPAVLFRGYGRRKEYLPLAWFNLIKPLSFSVHQMLVWESSFQSAARAKPVTIRSRLKNNPVPLTRVDISELDIESGILRYRSRLKKFCKLLLGKK